MKKILTFISPLFVYFASFGISFAQYFSSNNCTVYGSSSLKDVIMNFVIGCVLVRSIYLIMAIAFLAFLYGVLQFIRAEGAGKEQGKEFIFWGIVGLFVMVSVWGLIAVLQSTFHLGGNFNINPQQINIPSL